MKAILYTSMQICDFSAAKLENKPALLRVDSEDTRRLDDNEIY